MFLLLPVALYLALLTFAWLFSDAMLFLPHPSAYRDNAEILKLTTRGGNRISAVHLPNPEARYTLLVSHGNAEDLRDDRYWLASLRSAGFGVFAFDYEGYGTSEGKPGEQALYDDEDAAYEYLVGTLGIRPDHIIIFGRSVGSGPAVHLAARKPAAALILQSPFLSAFRVLTRVPLLPWDKFPNYKRIGHVRCPVLIIHGTADEVIPFWHGQKLLELVRAKKDHYWVERAGHNNLEDVAGGSYIKALQAFAASLDARDSR